jgi:Ner family transcriptional regulator
MAGLHPEEIKARLRMKYGSMSAFEITRGLPKDSVRDALKNGRPRIERAIAEALGLTPEFIWPHRFVRGERRLHSSLATGNTRARGESRLKAGAV